MNTGLSVGIDMAEIVGGGLEEVLAEVLLIKDEQMGKLAADLCRLRTEAISARAASGIEEAWQWCVMSFSGEDEITSDAGSAGSKGVGGTLMVRPPAVKQNRSTAVLNITAPAVEFAGWAILQLAAPTEKQRWGLVATPMTDVDEALAYLAKLPPEQVEMLRGALTQQKLTSQEEIAAVEKQIKDWFAESPVPFRDVLLRLFEDAPRMGSGVLKGPVPMMGEKGIQPGFRVVAVENIFPAPDCGEDIRNGSYLFERSYMSKRQLMEKGKPEAMLDGWLPDAVLEVVAEGPKPAEGVAGMSAIKEFELWHYHGVVPRLLLELSGVEWESAEGDETGETWACVTLVNKTVVKVGPAPLENEIPYHLLKWRKRWINEREFWAGRGIAEEGEPIQRSATAHLRNLNDNSALASVPQRVHWKGALTPMDGSYEWSPGKDWFVENKEFSLDGIKTVQNAFQFIEVPAHLAELRANIQLDLQLFQKITGIDDMVMGHTEAQSVGGGQMRLNAAAHLPRRVKAYYDASILRPAVALSVKWIRKYKAEELPLGEVTVSIEGSATEIKRDVQAASLIQAINLATNPVFGQDPALLMEKYLEGNEFDPERTKLSPEREQHLSELMAAAAKEGDGGSAQAQAAVQSAQLRAQALTTQGQLRAQSHALETQATMENAARDRAHDEQMLVLQMKLELLQYAQKKGIDLRVAQQELEAVTLPMKAIEHGMEKEKKEMDNEVKKEAAKGVKK